MNVLVYEGRGVSELCHSLTVSSLRRVLGRSYDIKAISATGLISEPWESNCALLVVPGGRDLPYLEDWSHPAVRKVQRYVREAGGTYLGICAGAYFGSGRVHFSVPGQGDIEGARPLGFLPGIKAIGPAFGAADFSHDSHAGAGLIPLVLGDKPSVRVYCNGSCWFEFGPGSTGVEVIASYEDGRPAIIKSGVGKGKVLLTGPHVEFDRAGLLPIQSQLPSTVQASLDDEDDEGREGLWRELLQDHLGLALVRGEEEEDPTELLIYADPKVVRLEMFNGIPLPGLRYAQCNEDGLSFDPSVYLDRLQTETIGRQLIYAERIPSTQTLLTGNPNLSMALPDGTVILAGDQLAGKGRGSNGWISSTGCLQFTMIKDHPITAATAPLSIIQYLVATAMVEAIGGLAAGGLRGAVRIKWPNDLYAMGKKVSGILVNSTTATTTTAESRSVRLFIGVGTNVHDTPWSVSLRDLVDQGHKDQVTKERLLASFFNQFEWLYTQMVSGAGFPYALYYSHWLHTDEIVDVEEQGGSLCKARIQGIDKDGYLIAQSLPSTGLQSLLQKFPVGSRTLLLQPDGNSFDMMKKLIRRKI